MLFKSLQRFLFILVLLAITECGFAQTTINSVATGVWTSTATWSGAVTPSCSNNVININAGHKVTVNAQINLAGCGSGILVNIYGELAFQNGQKLDLPCGSVVAVHPGGSITSGGGGGSSNLISICGNTVWRAGDGNITSPTNLSNGGVGLPVELTSFEGEAQGSSIVLTWSTATEQNNKHFAIERSDNGIDFDHVDYVASKAVNGNSISTLNYSFTDSKPHDGVCYYRLKQEDIDGTFEYTQVVAVNFSKTKDFTFTLYPNPNKGEFIVDFTGLENDHKVNVIVFDQAGRKVYDNHFPLHSAGTNKIEIFPQEKLEAGVYICSLVLEGIRQEIRVIVQ